MTWHWVEKRGKYRQISFKINSQIPELLGGKLGIGIFVGKKASMALCMARCTQLQKLGSASPRLSENSMKFSHLSSESGSLNRCS
jgi:hypothetical protein